jgi:SAM-dependent methyltransferase
MNEWERGEVVTVHKYLDDPYEVAIQHSYFSAHLDTWAKNHKKEVSIIDIGCGNARVLNSISGYRKYLGIDVNQSLITENRKNHKNNKAVDFIKWDIDKGLPEELFDMSAYNIAYLDSTLQMMEDPSSLLEKLLYHCDIVFLNRMHVEPITVKGENTWGGMNKPSVLWAFAQDFYLGACEKLEKKYYQGKEKFTLRFQPRIQVNRMTGRGYNHYEIIYEKK